MEPARSFCSLSDASSIGGSILIPLFTRMTWAEGSVAQMQQPSGADGIWLQNSITAGPRIDQDQWKNQCCWELGPRSATSWTFAIMSRSQRNDARLALNNFLQSLDQKRPPIWRPFLILLIILQSDDPQRGLAPASVGHQPNAGKTKDHHGPSRSLRYARSEVGRDLELGHMGIAVAALRIEP